MPKLTRVQKETLALFTSGAEKLEKAVNGLSEKELDYSIAPVEWTIRQIVHHVSEDGDAWSMVLKKALANSGVLIHPGGFPGNEAWAKALAFDRRPIQNSLALLKAHRNVISELAKLFPDAWGKYVTYPDASSKKTKIIRFGQIIRMLGEHLNEHLTTIEAIKKKHGL